MGVSHIAQTLGIARNTVYNWMANGNAPLNQLLALEGLGVDIVYVLTGKPGVLKGTLEVNQEMRPYGLSKDEDALIEGFRRCSPEMRAAALRMLASAGEIGGAIDGAPPRIKIRGAEKTGGQPKVEDRIEIRTSERPSKKFTPPKKRGGEG